jgi:diguanylate cyclase (GGDEF)-like protein
VARRKHREVDPLSAKPKQSVIRTRWVLLIGLAYIVLFGSGEPAPVWPNQVLVVVALLSNVLLILLLGLGYNWLRLRWFFTGLDVLSVSIVVGVVGRSSTDLLLIYFAVLLVAMAVPRVGMIASITLIGCVVYGSLLYLEVGPDLWRSSELLVRLPFMLGIALYFSTLVHEAGRDHLRTHKLETDARRIAERAKHLAEEQYRLKTLSEIGRLGLSGVPAEPGKVLFDITQRVQKVVGIDRCSLVIFEKDKEQAYLAASGDDASVEIRVLALEEYPELQASLVQSQPTEVYPGNPPDLWEKMQKCLPPANPFRAFLVVPIQRGSRLLGAFYLRDVRPDHRYSEDDRNFCSTAAMMTAAFIHGHDLLEQLRRQSRRDGLTGLLNFQAFTREVSRVVAKDAGRGEPWTLVVADLDNLKTVNDDHGHTAGNSLIITAAHTFASSLSGAAAVCRYGGDEFVALVPGPKRENNQRLERFLTALELAGADLVLPPSISVGIAEYPTDGAEPDTLMEAADQAMYLAKNRGGNQICRAGEGLDDDEWKRAVLEAVVSVQARRYLPDDDLTLEEILEPLTEAHGHGLDSPIVKETLGKLMDAVEAKDPYTHAHSTAVAELALRLAEAMAFPVEELTAIEIAGLVHDVGKIGVPEEILSKKGKLSSIERRVMERHPEVAARLLEQIPPLREVVPLVFCHQERWDGSGYPNGLKGAEIPPGAQVVAVCDAYHALTSARAFRSALMPEEARRVLERDAGRLWDPHIVQVFLERVVHDDGAAA